MDCVMTTDIAAPLTDIQQDSIPLPLSNEQLGVGKRVLYDGFQCGARMHWHDFPACGVSDWLQTFPKQTVVLCLNLLGQATVRHGKAVFDLGIGTAGVFCTGMQEFEAVRQRGKPHRFVTIEFSRAWLRRQLSCCDGALHPAIEAFLAGNHARMACGWAQKMTGEQETCARRLVQPPVFQRGRELWYQGQALQLMAEYFFQRQGEDELFCDRQKRLGQERAQKVMAILQRDLIDPPNLEAIAREAGCSPFHLSRTFSQEARMTIPQCLRKLRIDRAAELLQTGKYNVTEAALEVGYSSLSHFSQAFCQTKGCCPGLYPLKTATQRQ
jgi:AraC family transcriptional regulator